MNLQKWSEANGFQRRFSQNSWLHSSDGHFFLGGSEGLDVVRPEDLVHDSPPPPVRDSRHRGDRRAISGSGCQFDALPNAAHSSRRRRSHNEAGGFRRRRRFRRPRLHGSSAQPIFLQPQRVARQLDRSWSFEQGGAHGPRTGRTYAQDTGSRFGRRCGTAKAPRSGSRSFRQSGARAGSWDSPPSSSYSALFAGVRLRTSSLERRARELGDLSMHIQDAREEERAAAARDVHDELGQLLTAVKMDLHWLKRHPEEAHREARLGESLELVDEAMESVKRISTRLRPKALDTLSLSEALSWQLEEFRHRTGIECVADIGPSTEGIDPRDRHYSVQGLSGDTDQRPLDMPRRAESKSSFRILRARSFSKCRTMGSASRPAPRRFPIPSGYWVCASVSAMVAGSSGSRVIREAERWFP